jgi:hypothetical protein
MGRDPPRHAIICRCNGRTRDAPVSLSIIAICSQTEPMSAAEIIADVIDITSLLVLAFIVGIIAQEKWREEKRDE